MQSELLVPYATLPTFLRERLKVPQKWPSLVSEILARLEKMRQPEQFLADDLLPAKELLLRFQEKTLTYLQVEEICKILLNSEEATHKTFLGGYRSQTVKDWLTLQRDFIKENIHIAHSGTVLAKIIQYDLPSTKRQIKTNQKAITEALSKLQSLHKSENTAEATFLKECGEASKFTEAELLSSLRLKALEQVKQIVPIYIKIEEILKNPEFKECLEYQQQYLLFFEMEQGIQLREPSLLRYFSQHGNTTLAYKQELKTKKMNQPLSKETQELQKRKYEVHSIVKAPQEVELVDASDSWDIVEVEEAEDKGETVKKEQNKEKADQLGRTILGCVSTRKSLMSELTALEAFLESRIFELQPSRDPQSFAVYEQGKPKLLNKESLEYVRKMLKPVSKALEILKSQQLNHLHRLQTDSSYVDEILNKTLQHRESARKYKEKGIIVSQRIENLRKELEENKEQARKLKERKNQIYERLQKDVSQLFPGVDISILL